MPAQDPHGAAPTVGRERELAEVRRFVGSLSSSFGCLVLRGEAGIGKTTLWRETVGLAEARGCRVLSCRPAERESRLSLAGLIDLCSAVGDCDLEALPGPQATALRVALLRADAEGRPPEGKTLAVGFLSLIRVLAERGSLLLAIDDVQWLDQPSFALLEFAARRLDREPAGLLVATRTSSARTFSRSVPEARRRVVQVGPLSPAALHEIVKAQLGISLMRPAALKVAHAADGNPFYALEIARAFEDGQAPEHLPAPTELRKVVTARVKRLPPTTRAALLVASALAEASIDHVDADALLLAEEEDIVRVEPDGRIIFTHPLYASAVYESAPRAKRRELHAKLAELARSDEDKARHLAHAATGADEAVAAALEQGAVQARSRGSWSSAAELLELARDLTPAELSDEAQRRAIRAAACHGRAGDRPRAKALLEELLAEEPPRAIKADALRLMGEIAYNEESLPLSARLFAQALDLTDDPKLAGITELGLAFVCGSLFDLPAGAVHSERAAALATSIADDGLLAEALTSSAMFDTLQGNDVDWRKVERALALEDPTRLVAMQARPSAVAALLCLIVGRLAEARERLLELRSTGIARGEEADLAYFIAWLCWLETITGHLADAERYADEAASLASLTGSKAMRTWVLAQRSLVHVVRGEIELARADLDEAETLAERTNQLSALPWIASSRGLLELSLDNPDRAFAAVETLTEGSELFGVPEPGVALHVPVAVEALIALGDLSRAEALLERFERRSRKLDRTWGRATSGRCRGLLLAARGDLAGAEIAYDAALAEHERLQQPFEKARTLLAAGQLQRRLKQRRAARQKLAAAKDLFAGVEAATWLGKTEAELGRTHLREAPRDLTPTELGIAELAASGLTNKQISERMFVSTKTVESNLSRVYRKLEIGRRVELGARLAELRQIEQEDAKLSS